MVWKEATESNAVPDTAWADRLIDRVFPSVLASAPVADNWQQYALPGETTAEQVCERMNAEVTRRTVAAMRASAPAAGEAQPVAWANENGDPISDALKQARPDLYGKHYTRPLVYAAPQASEAVRNAGIGYARSECTSAPTDQIGDTQHSDKGSTNRERSPLSALGPVDVHHASDRRDKHNQHPKNKGAPDVSHSSEHSAQGKSVSAHGLPRGNLAGN